MTGPTTHPPKDDDWCDWCGKEIRAQARRSHDGRVFCDGRCVAAYRAKADAPTVVELPVGRHPDE